MNLFNKTQTSSCVSCSVESCIYHSVANRCTANHIDVRGKYAQNEKDTICSTYSRKNGAL